MGSIISDRYIPQMAMDIVLEELNQSNNILSQGIVTLDTSPIIAKGGYKFEIPYIHRLSVAAGTGTRITNTTTLVPNSLTDTIEYGISVTEGNAISDTEFMNTKRGNDAVQFVRTQIAPLVQDYIQAKFNSVLKGVFATALATSHTYDVASEESDGGGLIKFKTPVLASNLIGEKMNDVKTMIVNSRVYSQLIEEGLQHGFSVADNAAIRGEVSLFAGKNVIVNDTIAYSYEDGGTTKYVSYLVGGQPLYLGIQRGLRIYEDENILLGGKTNIMAWYIDYVPHVKGVSYVSATNNPDNTALETGASWATRSGIDTKEIKIIKMISNL